MGSPAPAFGFTGINAAAQRAAARTAARLITAIARETMVAIRSLIVASIRDGIPPRETARAVRSMVGLNERQARAAEAYRRELEASDLSRESIDREMDRYVRRKIRERATTIARTEILGALNEGARASWREAQADGLLAPDTEQEWIATPGERTCPICDALDGKRVQLGEPFVTIEGDEIPGPPAHPNCRCSAAPVPA